MNNRRFPRVPAYNHARIETLVEPLQSLSGTLFEVGSQGCGIRAEGDLETGSEVKISLFDHTRRDPIVFKAKVMWKKIVGDSQVRSYGLQFLKCESGYETAGGQEFLTILSEAGSKFVLDND